MRALMIKDWKLLKGQKQFFGVIGIISLGFLITNENPSFVISYVTIMFSVFSISTIQYDDFEKGFSYLFTLPVSRREYVAGKYLFGTVIILLATGLMTVAAVLVSRFRGISLDFGEVGASVLSSLLIAAFFLAIAIPLQLKFGSEKGRIAWMALFMVVFLIVFAGGNLLQAMNRSPENLLKTLEQMPMSTFVFGTLAVILVLLAVSIAASIRFLDRREF